MKLLQSMLSLHFSHTPARPHAPCRPETDGQGKDKHDKVVCVLHMLEGGAVRRRTLCNRALTESPHLDARHKAMTAAAAAAAAARSCVRRRGTSTKLEA